MRLSLKINSKIGIWQLDGIWLRKMQNMDLRSRQVALSDIPVPYCDSLHWHIVAYCGDSHRHFGGYCEHFVILGCGGMFSFYYWTLMYILGKAITLRWFLTSALFRLWKMVKSSNSAFLPCSPWHVSTLALHLNSPYGAVFISQRKSPPELGERGNPLLIFPKNLAWTGRNVLNPGQRDTFQNSWKQIQTDWSFQQ